MCPAWAIGARGAETTAMQIAYGYRIDIACDHPTPVIAMLDVHPERRIDISNRTDRR